MIEYLPTSKHHTELYLTQYGTENCIPSHFFGPAVRSHYLLHYILEGEGIYEVGGNTYKLSKGQGFLIVPEEVTYYQADEANPWSYCWVGFNGALAETLLKQAGLSMASPILNYDKHEIIHQYLSLMIGSKEYHNASECRLTGILYLLLSEFIESSPSTASIQKENRSELYIEKVKDFIQMNYAQKISIENIANFIGLNRSYLCSLFNKQTGTSIQDYLIHFRINKACELMGNVDLSIGDISRSVGYYDPLLFSKIFKKIKGLSPKHFRNNLDMKD